MQAPASYSGRPDDGTAPLLPVAGAFIADPDTLSGWAAGARTDDRCIYARVAMLARGGVGERARQLSALGVIDLRRSRCGFDAALFNYVARRTERPFADGRCFRGAMTADDQRLFSLLAARADAGAPCPSDAQLAALMGLRTAGAASGRLHRLRQMGRVIVASSPHEPGRIVTIVETGAATAVSGGAAA